MADYAILLVQSPLNLDEESNGVLLPLTKASNRTIEFSEDGATISFALPGNSSQCAAIEPLVHDVLLLRDDEILARGRVVSRTLDKGETLTASFTAVSYKALTRAWIMHEADTRSWASPTEQTAIAWSIFNTAQGRTNSDVGTTRGPTPTLSENRTLTGASGDGNRPAYFDAGTTIFDAIDGLAQLDKGFDWDILPDPAGPYIAQVFYHWTEEDGGRGTTSGFILDGGGNVAGWTHATTPSEFGNVVRVVGETPTSDNATSGTGVSAWYPATKNPVTPDTRGRWERDVSRTDLTTSAAVTAAAPKELAKRRDYLSEITVRIARGRWEGPSDLWFGDTTRLLISEPVFDTDGGVITYTPGAYVIDIDETVRVMAVSISVDDLGAEDVTMTLNRKPASTARDSRLINDRLRRLERR